jgi:uridine phosphorylase
MPTTPTDPDKTMPITGVRARDLPARMLVVGDPKRAKKAAQHLDDAHELGHNREYLTIAGSYKGTRIGVASHGVGSAGATACFEELCRAGATHIVRAGTAGGIQPHVLDGALVIASAAVRAEGTSARLVPPSFPATSSVDMVLALRDAAASSSNRSGRLIHEGVVLTDDLFYPHDVLGGDLPLWQRAGVIAVEMEVSALFVTAALHGIAAGAILAIDGNPLRGADEAMAGYDPNRDVVTAAVDDMITAGLNALAAVA